MGVSIKHFLSALAAGMALSVGSASAVTDTWIGTAGSGGSGNWDTSSLNWNDGTTPGVAFVDGNDVVFDNTNNADITMVGTVLPASISFNAGGANYRLLGAGTIGGTGSLNKAGTGELQINQVHSFTGKTTITAGVLRLTNSGGLSMAGVNGPLGAPVGANATIDLLNDSTFQTGGVEPRLNQVTDRTLNLAGTGAGTVTIRVNDNDTRFNFGAVTATGTGAKTLRLFMGNSGNGDRESVIFTGGIADSSDASPTSFTVSFNTGNSAHLSLVGTNTFTGSISAGNVNGGQTGVSTLTVGGLFTGPNAANGLPTENVRGTGSLGGGNYAGNISLGTKTILNYRSTNNQTLGGVISGAGALTVDGLSTVTLSGLNTYTGNTTVPTGSTLALSNTGGMTFAVANASANKITGAGTATLDGAFTIDTAAVTNATGSWTLVDATGKSFGATFAVNGFTQAADVWTLVAGSKTWTFTESTGVLALTSTAVFTSFGIPGYPGVIDNNLLTIRLIVPQNADLTTLAPTYTVASGTVNQPNDGTTPPTPTFAVAVGNTVTYTLTSGATVKNYAVTAVPATGIINYAVSAPGGPAASTLAGPNGVAAGTETWNQDIWVGQSPSLGANLLDSVGATAAGVQVTTSGFGGPDDWGSNADIKLFHRSARVFHNSSYSGSAGSFTISGLAADSVWDLWIATSHINGSQIGDWTTSNTNTTGASLTVNNTGNNANNSVWVAGVNYVLFQNVVATGGSITMTSHSTQPNTTDSRVGFNGFQLLPATAPPANDYNSWLALFTFAPGADTTPTGDPDGDGLNNQQEYAFGLNPTSGSSVNPVTVPLSGSAFSYTRRATSGLTYTVWTSTTLAGWVQDNGAIQNPLGTPDGNGVQTVAVTLTATPVGGKLFVRVQAN